MMESLEWKNPIYNRIGTIDVDINHPDFGWIPFTASPDDPMAYGKDIYEHVLASGVPIAPYVPPPEAPPPPPSLDEQVAALTARLDKLEKRKK